MTPHKQGLLVLVLSSISTLLFHSENLQAQVEQLGQLALDDAYEMLEQQYPTLQNSVIWLQIQNERVAQIQAEAKPGVYWKTDASLQSESVQLNTPEGTALPFEISRPLVSAQSYLEGNYLLLDGGIREAREAAVIAETAVELQQVEVDRFQLRERVNSLFLSLSSLRVQGKLYELSLADLENRIAQAEAGVENGVLLESELAKLQVHEKELQAQQNSINYQIEGVRTSLESLLGVSLAPDVALIYPALPPVSNIPPINRPEQALFLRQQSAILAQEALINSEKKPKLQLFAQAGVGYPNPLNLLDSDPAPYAIIGAGLSWKLIDWDKSRRQKEILTLQTLQVQNQQATFEFNLQQQEASYQAEVQRLQAQLKSDQEIADLQAVILEQSAAQLEEGVITTVEYLSQSTAELRARQQLKIHEVQLLQIQLEFMNNRGNQR